MIPVNFPESNRVLAINQDEYEPLHIHLDATEHGIVTCAFRLSDAEIEEIVRTRTLWHQQMTFRSAFQPVMLSTQKPIIIL